MEEQKQGGKSGTRRDRRIQRQRQDIMDAAASLFANQGFAATTTKDIAQAADIGESTLYSYFPSKREILLAILDQQVSQVDEIVTSISAMDDAQSYIATLDLLLEKIMARINYTRALIAEAWVNMDILNEYVIGRIGRITRFLENIISERIKTGEIRPVDPRIAAQMIIATVVSATLPVLRGIQPPPSSDERKILAERIFDLILNGIALHPRL